jgi:hypothetical protein
VNDVLPLFSVFSEAKRSFRGYLASVIHKVRRAKMGGWHTRFVWWMTFFLWWLSVIHKVRRAKMRCLADDVLPSLSEQLNNNMIELLRFGSKQMGKIKIYFIA